MGRNNGPQIRRTFPRKGPKLIWVLNLSNHLWPTIMAKRVKWNHWGLIKKGLPIINKKFNKNGKKNNQE